MDMRDRPPRRSCSRTPRPCDSPGSAQNSTQKKAMDFLEDESHSGVASFPGSLDERLVTPTVVPMCLRLPIVQVSHPCHLTRTIQLHPLLLSCILFSEQSLSSTEQGESDSTTSPTDSTSDDSESANSSTSADVPGGEDKPYKLTALYKSLIESKTPLYPGSEVTILDSYILLYEYALRHKLTKEAFSELLQLVSVHLPSSANSAKSVYLLQKYFEKHFNDTTGECYYYCIKCHRQVEGASNNCPSGCTHAGLNKFLYIPVEPQLKRLEGIIFKNNVHSLVNFAYSRLVLHGSHAKNM